VKLVLLHSPLTGPVVWQNLAPLLQARGFDVLVPDYRHVLAGPPPYYEKIAREIARPPNASAVLIVHSGAGALVPSIAYAANDWMKGAVFTDALLPHPGKCWFDTVPVPLAARLRSMMIDGRLPAWDRWWPQGTLEAMLPNTMMRRGFIAELPSLPLRYFEELAPDAPPLEKFRCAFLQLSSGYDAEALEAQRRGWLSRSLSLHHLAMLTHPGDVADELYRLVRALA
jgi:hypothetical protein